MENNDSKIVFFDKKTEEDDKELEEARTLLEFSQKKNNIFSSLLDFLVTPVNGQGVAMDRSDFAKRITSLHWIWKLLIVLFIMGGSILYFINE